KSLHPDRKEQRNERNERNKRAPCGSLSFHRERSSLSLCPGRISSSAVGLDPRIPTSASRIPLIPEGSQPVAGASKPRSGEDHRTRGRKMGIPEGIPAGHEVSLGLMIRSVPPAP